MFLLLLLQLLVLETTLQIMDSINGCDSIVTLTLTVNPTFATSLTANICQGSDYTENGFNLTNVQESGTYTQTLTAMNGCDCVIVLNLTVTSSLADMERVSTLSAVLYPNPTEDFATLRLENLRTNAELIVFDVQGRAVIRKEIATGEDEIRLDLTTLASGAYYVRITSSEGIINRKLIKR